LVYGGIKDDSQVNPKPNANDACYKVETVFPKNKMSEIV